MADNLEKSHMEITHKNDEIMASINYAKRIQEAIMPAYEEVSHYLKNHFIYYRPKDVVAGDFYWFEATDEHLFIAAADCTGHGVPGAMVSVVCSNSLNQAVKEMKLTEPAEILNMVRDLVITTFEKSQHDVKDGMDICFCRINLKTREVVFSGAQNSLYRVTRKPRVVENEKAIFDDTHLLIEYKGDKQPIGKFTFLKPFSQTSITCEKGDYLYLFTDGYADQFGGPEGRKFMYKPFKKLLLSLHGKEMESQKRELETAFKQWMGNESQVDDICVIGIGFS
jgi:serine phosphatase RsbU (regulator of sigma subunit)